MKNMICRMGLAVLLGLAGSVAAQGEKPDQPYKLGYLLDASGPQQTTIKPAYEGFKLFIDELNARGGVNGRQIEIVAKDTQSDVQRSLDAVQDLGRQKVLGILGLAASNAHAAVYTAAGRQSIPVLAGYPVNIPLVLSPAKPNTFGVGLELSRAGTVGGKFARQVSPEGKSTVCVAFEVPGSILACEKIVATAKEQGFTQTEIITVPLPQRDFRTVVERIVRANPDVVTMCLGQGHVASLLPALANSGYEGIFLSMDTGIGERTLLAAVPPESKLTVYSYGRFISNAKSPGSQVEQLSQALSKAGMGEIEASYAGGWTLGLVTEQALKNCPNGCKSSKDFEAALNAVDVDTGGLTGVNVKFTPEDHFGDSAYRLYKLDNRARTFSTVGDWVNVAGDGVISLSQ